MHGLGTIFIKDFSICYRHQFPTLVTKSLSAPEHRSPSYCFLLLIMLPVCCSAVCFFVCSLVTQSCPTLYDPMDYSSLGSSIYGISQARILKWVAISFSRGSSPPRDRTCFLHQQADSLPLSHQASPNCMVMLHN